MSQNTAKICGCIGYGPEHLPWNQREDHLQCVRLKRRLQYTVAQAIAEGYTHFICGMNRGVETFFAEIVLDMRVVDQSLQLFMVLPNYDYTRGWYSADRDRHRLILTACDRVIFDCTPANDYYKSDIICKQHILQLASKLVAVYNYLPIPTTEQVLQEAGRLSPETEITPIFPIDLSESGDPFER